MRLLSSLVVLLGSLVLMAATLPRFQEASGSQEAEKAGELPISFLEIVSSDPAKTIATLEAVHGVPFGDPVPMLGNARLAKLSGGGLLSVRGKLRPDETPVVRPYVLVEDIAAAVKAAADSGAEIALPGMPIPGYGTCAIYIHEGIEHGLWQE